MNKRIQSTALKHDRIWNLYAIGPVQREEVERFAHDIINDVVDELENQLFWHGFDTINNPAWYKAVERLKAHFGADDEPTN